MSGTLLQTRMASTFALLSLKQREHLGIVIRDNREGNEPEQEAPKYLSQRQQAQLGVIYDPIALETRHGSVYQGTWWDYFPFAWRR